MWLATESTTGTFTGLDEAKLSSYLPELAVSGGKFTSKAGNGVTIDVAPATVCGAGASEVKQKMRSRSESESEQGV